MCNSTLHFHFYRLLTTHGNSRLVYCPLHNMWALDIQVLAGDSRQNEQDHFYVGTCVEIKTKTHDINGQ